ncbi:Retrovirus-related Pol polyprotein from transposon [Trichinella papuae]|uniref:Retrovirus-related Pol polyprotein from transposon n=1 Tax=Trichinella papuae TaxID=268474 RepID=A0A0V1MX57_9BILA|nr:Retrovirus-related Pol polyprotein from transposon [Trichinella papuae]
MTFVKNTAKNGGWSWGPEQEEALTKLKSALSSPSILSHPHFDRPFLLDVDASEDALGAVLSQLNHQGLPVVIAYASRSLSQPERKYCATRREMLVLVWATRHFRPYLYGRKFTARTDHNAKFREPEGQVARSLERLAEYEFEVVHRPGQQHRNTDALSRRVCKHCGAMNPTADAQVAAMTLGPTGRIQEWQDADPELRQIRGWLEKRDSPQCNEPLSRAGSFVASTGLLPRSSLSVDAPVSTCGFVSASALSIRLLPALPLRFPSSRFVGNIPAFKRQSKSTIFISK